MNEISGMGICAYKENVRVLCLMTVVRGGSKLFHSFLDWHPQIIGFPRTLQFNRFWKTVAHRADDLEYVLDSFIKMHPRFFSGESWYLFNKYDRADQLGPDRNETFSVDIKSFREKAIGELKGKNITRASLFVSLNLAYHAACGRKIPENPIILNHIHDVAYHDELKACMEDFSDVRLLVLTRHTVEGLNSCLNWMRMQNTLSCAEMYHHQKQALCGIEDLIGHFPSLDIKVLPFEQLHIRHREVMETFVNWVGIGWDDSLLVSTMHGKLWWGNGKIPRNGTNPNWEVYQPSGFLERKDWSVISALMPGQLRVCGYIRPPDDRHRRRGVKLFASILFPTATEWSLLKSSANPLYWVTVIRDVLEEIRDPRLTDHDFYTKKELPDDKKIPGHGAHAALVFTERFFTKFFSHIRMVNPILWFYYVTKRIVYHLSRARLRTGEKGRSPVLLGAIS